MVVSYGVPTKSNQNPYKCNVPKGRSNVPLGKRSIALFSSVQFSCFSIHNSFVPKHITLNHDMQANNDPNDKSFTATNFRNSFWDKISTV